MEEYIADEQGHIAAPGVQALYPPGTPVWYVNGQYAGHGAPPPEPVEEQAKVPPEASATSETQPLMPVNQAEGA